MKILSPLRTVSALLCAALAPSLVYDSSAKAATNVYFRFEGTGAIGEADGAVIDSSGNQQNGTAIALGNSSPAVPGVRPVYSTDTAGPTITNGLGGTPIGSGNTGSVKFNNPGVESNNLYNLNSGGQIRVAVTSSNAALLQPRNFTAEAFIKAESNISFASLFGMSGGNGTISWQLDNNPNNNQGPEPTVTTMRYRADHQMKAGDPDFVAGGGNDSSLTPVAGTNSNFGDGKWHHVAITYDEQINQFRLYMDYVNVANGTLNSGGSQDLVYTQGGNSYLIIGGGGGGRGFDGWIDEFRLSDTILDVNQFLYAVPEPGRAMLLMLGVGLFAFTRRRSRAVVTA